MDINHVRCQNSCAHQSSNLSWLQLNCNEEVASQLVYMVFLQLIDHDPICIQACNNGLRISPKAVRFINIALHCNIFVFRKTQGCLVARYYKRRLCCICSIVTCLVCHGHNFWVDSCYSLFNTILSKSFSLSKFLFSFHIKSCFLFVMLGIKKEAS